MGITFRHKGNLSKTTQFLKRAKAFQIKNILEQYGQAGISALSAATPVESGLTANSWYYKIEKSKGSVSIAFYNSNIQNGVPIAVILQYGHGTKNGGWVQGRDYINPAIRPIFDAIVEDAWKEVTKI